MSKLGEWRRVIAHAWKNPDFMARLKADPKTTLEDKHIRTKLCLKEIGKEGNYFPVDPLPKNQENRTEAELREIIQKNGEQIFGCLEGGKK